MRNYPDLHVTVDLREDLQIIKTYFNEVKNFLYSLIIDNGITEGFLNYDTQIAKYQLKDGKTKSANMLKDLDLIECEIEGNIARCRIFGCKLTNCQIEDSVLVMNNDVEDSKIIDCDLSFSNVITNSYIDSKEREISCEISGGVIRSGYITKMAEISGSTEIITNSADAKGKDKGKGKGGKMIKTSVFPDRNYEDIVAPKPFEDLNNRRPAFSVNKLYKNNN
jgi:hypothetical protein